MKNILKSSLDKSVNWIIPKGTGHLEARYVRRDSDHISAYVSSHNGCKMGCRMCYLTQQKQTAFNHTTLNEFSEQFNKILDYYDANSEVRASRVNVNFMARGEPLANANIINKFNNLYDIFDKRSVGSSLQLRMNISTIMPHTIKHLELNDILHGKADIYYSMYSVNDNFRSKWLPNALPYEEALIKLKNYQIKSNRPITFHWTFIKGENDNKEDVIRLTNILKNFDFFGKFNLVRYNPPVNILEREEPTDEELNNLLSILKNSIRDNAKSKIVSRVGKDVYASCGMFIPA